MDRPVPLGRSSRDVSCRLRVRHMQRQRRVVRWQVPCPAKRVVLVRVARASEWSLRPRLKRAERLDDATHRLHVARRVGRVVVDHDQVRVRARCVQRDANARARALTDGPVIARAARRQHAKKTLALDVKKVARRRAGRRKRFERGKESRGAVRARLVARHRGEARVQAEQTRARGARKRGGELVVARHAHGHVAAAVGRDAPGDERVLGFKREEGGRGGHEELDGGARLRAEASRDVAVAAENRVGDALGA